MCFHARSFGTRVRDSCEPPMWMVGIEPSSSRRAASVLIPLSHFSSPSGRILDGDQSGHHLRESVEETLVQAQKHVSVAGQSGLLCRLPAGYFLPHSPGIRTQMGEKVHPYLYFLCFSCRISFSGRQVSRLVHSWVLLQQNWLGFY